MERVKGVAGSGDTVTLEEQEERENLVAYATKLLKEESDIEVQKSMVQLLQGLRTNAEVRRSFHENGWGFIQKVQKCDLKVQQTSTSSSLKEEQDQEQRKIHPMHIDHIREKIFEYCSVRDLKSCRLVSKSWRDFSMTFWREKAVLKLENLFGSDENDIEEVIRNASEFQTVPFQNYNMEYSDWFLRKDSEEKVFDYFRSSIKYVKLFCVDLDSIKLLLTRLSELRAAKLVIPVFTMFKRDGPERKCTFHVLQNGSSNLRKLELQIVPPRIFFREKSYLSRPTLHADDHFPWKKFFESVPTLTSLKISYDKDVVPFWDMVMGSLYEVRMQSNFSVLNLEQLDIIDSGRGPREYPWGAVDKIHKCNFPLQTLCIDLGLVPVLSEISRLMEAHAETLQHLKFKCNLCLTPYELNRYPEAQKWQKAKEYIELPLTPDLPSKCELSNLKGLVVVGSGCLWAFNLLRSWDTPNLESFRIEIQTPKKAEEGKQDLDLKRTLPKSEVFSAALYLPSLRTFYYNGQRRLSIAELRGFGNAMTNLRNLTIPLGEKTFPIIFELWSDLQSLHLLATGRTYFLCDDQAITGYCSFGNYDRRESNITGLKSLRKFRLETWPEKVGTFPRPRKPWVSDVSAIYGFLQLPRLEFLQMDTICEFSPEIKAALENHISQIRINDPEIFYDFDVAEEDNEENEPLQEQEWKLGG